MPTQKIVAITGASNGMGYESALLFAKQGWKVYGGARRVEKIPTAENIVALKLDVTDSESNKSFIETILEAEGKIDVLINNAGYGEYGPTEEISIENAKKQFDTNYFGAVELTNLVLPSMRAQQSGRIVNISSIGGNIYMPMGAHYHATKAALQQWSDALDTEVSQFGVRSVIVQPGGTVSDWGKIAFDNALKNSSEDSAYRPMIDMMASAFTGGFGPGASSADLAKDFYKAATDEKPKLRYFHSMGDRAVVRLGKSHPVLYKRILKIVLNRLGKRK